MGFYKIIGHQGIKLQIANSIKLNRFSHAHILVGENGIGKSMIAKEMAMKVLGKSEFKQYVDIVEFKVSKGKKSIGIEEVKNIIEETNKKPYECDKKVIILYNSDKMTEAAQNALLKTIEEPPSGSFMVLLCEKLDGILDTIKSRCQIYKFNRLSQREMFVFLKNRFPDLPKEQVRSVLAFSDGIPGRAEKFISDSFLSEMRNTVISLLRGLNDSDLNSSFKISTYLLNMKDQWPEVLTCVLSYIRDVLIYKETGSEELIINTDKFEDIKIIGEMFSFNKLNDIINIVKDTREKLERNVSPALVFDSMLVKMQEV
ncbi:DNA polymerase III subunit delta' [Clostridium sp. JNZ X4-2]